MHPNLIQLNPMTRYIIKHIFLLLLLLTSAPGSAYPCPPIDGISDINCDGKLVILCFGDSITFGRGDSTGLGYPGRLKMMLPSATVINRGVPGENTYTGRVRAAAEFPKYQADYIVILQGVNDFWVNNRNASPAVTRNNLLEIKALAESLGAHAVLANLLPVNRTDQGPWPVRVNNLINPFVQVDFFSLGKRILVDNLHPGGSGYHQMALRVRDYLLTVPPSNNIPPPHIKSIKVVPLEQ
jgi:lysophospholipase L1-like esterase